jgi:hypothetical protein
MLRLFPVILVTCVMLSGPLWSATTQPAAPGTTEEATQQNPFIDDVARNDPDGLRSLLRRLEVLTTGQRDSGPARSGSVPTAGEFVLIRTNPLLSRAYTNDPAATLALLRATSDALDRARHRESLEPHRRIALIIGNSGDSAWGILGTTRNDASLVANALTRQRFELFEGHTWLDLDRRNLLQVIHNFSRSITPDTVALVYYAGHGVRSNGRNFLVPANAAMPRNDDDYDRDLVAVDDILLRQMHQTSDRLSIIVLDACDDRPASLLAGTVRHGAQQTARGFAPIGPHESGTIIIYSTGPDSVAHDSADNTADSPFARAFATAIDEPGLEIRDVFDRVETMVDRATNHRQQPWISYSAIGRFYFGAPAIPTVGLPSVAIDDGPFHCPVAGTTVALDLAGGTVTGSYEATDPADPVLCRLTFASETKALLYNFFDARSLLGQTSIRAGMNDLLSKHLDQVEFELPYSFVSRSLEAWKRLGIEMLPIDGRYVRTVKFERTRRQVGFNNAGAPVAWFVWYDPATSVFVKSERLAPSNVVPSLGGDGMPGAFKVISLIQG